MARYKQKIRIFSVSIVWGAVFFSANFPLMLFASEKKARHAFTQRQYFSLSPHFKLEIKGIKNAEARENAEIYCKMIDPQEMDGSERNLYLVRQAIEQAISVFGYFNSTIHFTLTPPNKAGDKGILLAVVDQGEPTKIRNTYVRIKGEAKQDPAFLQLLKTLPEKGTQLSQQSYDNFKGELGQLGLERGYFNAEFQTAHLDVRPSTKQGWWNIVYDSGARYKFGHFSFENNQIRTDYLQHIMQMKDGDPYNMEQLVDFNTHLSSSGWFNFVLFQPTVNHQKKEVDINILFFPRKKNIFKIGGGYSTDEGPHFQMSWNKPWVNDEARSLRSNFYFSRPKISAEITYHLPLLENPLKYYYEVAYGIEREKENDTVSNANTTSITRYWNRESTWQNAFGLQIRYDAFTQANEKHKTLLVYPSITAARTDFSGELFPTWGDTLRLSFDLGSKVVGSHVNFFKIQASTVWIRTFFKNHRFIGRAEIGYLNTSSFDEIPPSLRFFIGGDRTLRGYGYKKIAPRDSEGKLVGGSKMASASIEYNYQVYPKWWLAIFYDTGLASNKFRAKDLHYGTGVGVRWVSPVGALKLDIATPVRDKHHSKNVQFYLGLGTEL